MRSSKKQKSWRLLPVLAACLLAATGAFGTWLALAPGTQNFDGATKVSLQNLDANVRTIAATITASPTISAARVAGIVLPAEPGGWGLYLAPTTRYLCFGKIGVSEVCSSQSVTLGTAHHVASTFDGSTVNLYVDGISSGSKPYKETFDAKGAPYLIGGTRYEKWNSDNFFIGSIGNVRAYSSALDATQIAALATGKLSNAEFALIGSWLGDAPPPPSPVCGDGICQNAACTGTNCPVQETPGTCPQDCSCPMMMCPPTEPGCRYESTGKDANGCENTCGKLVCDQKPVTYCGDGIVQDKEQCDDKNRRPGDGCNGQCMQEFCGDRIVTSSRQEQCDDGNVVSGDGCSATCAFEYCGDGAVQATLGETCDDGNLVPGDGCDPFCVVEKNDAPSSSALQKPPVCGDGICQNVTCKEIRCPVAETSATCPKDCGSCPMIPCTTAPNCRYENPTKNANGCKDSCGTLVCQNADYCGDGICQDVSCQGTGCRAPETPANCSQDCKAPSSTLRVPNGVSDDLFGGAVPNVGDTLALQLQENVDNLSFPTAQKYLQAVSDDLRKKAIVNNGAMVIMDSRTGKSINIPNPTLPNDADPTYNNALHTIDLFGAGNLDYLLMNVRYTRADNRQLATAALRYVLTGGKYTYSIIGIETAVPSANGKLAYVGNTIVNLETGTSRKYARPSLGPEDGWNRALSISNDGTKIAFEGYAVTKQANGADALTATLAIVNTATNAVSRFVPALPANEYATVGAYVLSGDFSKIFCNSTRSMRSGTTAFVGVRPYVLDPATGTTRPLLGDMQSSLESPSYPYGYLYGPAVDSAAANGNRVLLRAHIYRNKDGGGLQTTPEYWAYDLPTQKLISLTSPLESAAPNKSSTPLGLAPDGQTVLMKNENDNLVRLHKLTSVFQ